MFSFDDLVLWRPSSSLFSSFTPDGVLARILLKILWLMPVILLLQLAHSSKIPISSQLNPNFLSGFVRTCKAIFKTSKALHLGLLYWWSLVATASKNLTRKGATFVISMDVPLLTYIRTEDKGGGDFMRSVHGDKLRCINYSMLCKVQSFWYKVNNTPTYSSLLLLLYPRTVVYDFPARIFRPSAATSNTWWFKQTLSNPGWRVMHTVRSPMASSMITSQRLISLQQMHSCAFVTRLTEQFEHEHLQSNVKNSSNTRKIRLYKIINCLTALIKLSHKIRTTANHIATKL